MEYSHRESEEQKHSTRQSVCPVLVGRRGDSVLMKWVTCDICGETLNRQGRVKIECKKWEDKRRGVMHIDLCKDCMNKVIDFLETNAILAHTEKIRKKETDESLQ